MRTKSEKTKRQSKVSTRLHKSKPSKHYSKASSSRATSSFPASLTARKTTEADEKVKALGEGRAPMQSFLRPGNTVGGGFGHTATDMLPRFVKSYWRRSHPVAD